MSPEACKYLSVSCFYELLGKFYENDLIFDTYIKLTGLSCVKIRELAEKEKYRPDYEEFRQKVLSEQEQRCKQASGS